MVKKITKIQHQDLTKKRSKIEPPKLTQKQMAVAKRLVRAEQKKRKKQKCDGLGPYEITKIRNALRAVWHRSYARKLVVDRCTHTDGFTYCEKCHKATPKLKIDHIEACGEVEQAHYIQRMWCPSKKLQGLCKECHDLKTKQERKELRGEFF